MFERFTDLARRVVVLAQEEARLLNHNYIGTEHLLLGLLHEDRGLARRALDELDVSLEAVRLQVMTIIGMGERAPSGHIPFTPRAKKVLELSLREALQLGTDYIGTEHLLLGLIREGQGVAAQVLTKLGKSLDEVRQTVITLYEQQPPEERTEQGPAPAERTREREEPSGFEPRFPIPGFLQRRGFARAGGGAQTARRYTEYLPTAAPRTLVRSTDPIAERPAEAAQLLAILARRERNNAMLVGQSGSGKSALVRGLAQTLAANRGPASLGSAEVIELDFAALRTGVDRIVRRGVSPVVLVEDLEMLLRADDLSGGRLVTAVASLAESEAPLVVTASDAARERFEQDFPTLATRFEAVEVLEASGPHTYAVLELLRPGLQDFHGVTIDDSALTAAIELAPHQLGGRVLPGGAVDLIDAAAARLAVREGTEADSPVLDEDRLRDVA